MRITDIQKLALVNGARKHFGEGAAVWLFGSRTDDAKRGGDVDVYIETDIEESLFSKKIDLLGDLFDAFGDQKIDILVRARTKAMSPIQIIAKDSGIELEA